MSGFIPLGQQLENLSCSVVENFEFLLSEKKKNELVLCSIAKFLI